MIVRLLIAIILGVLAFLLCELVLPHTIALLIGVLVGLVYYFGADGRVA